MKAISLLSSGIDSPVATYLMLERGVDVVCAHFDGRPYSDEHETERSLEIAGKLGEITGSEIRTYVVPFGEIKANMGRECNTRFLCLLCKRMMYLVSGELAKKEGADFLITGESLGQVASQTLPNLKVLDEAIDFPVARPLIGFDKEETIRISKKIGLYELSTAKGTPCGIAPKKPATKARVEQVREEESNIDVAEIVRECVDSAKSV